MSIALLETACAALDDLVAEVVFVGGATVGLWITDPAAPQPRPTKDVDIIVDVTTRLEYYAFEQRLREHRFREDRQSGVICRWRYADGDLVLDAMPTDAGILGFTNRWQAAAVPYALERELPSGRRIAAVSPPFLVATKLEAFAGRGRDDYIGGSFRWCSADFRVCAAIRRVLAGVVLSTSVSRVGRTPGLGRRSVWSGG